MKKEFRGAYEQMEHNKSLIENNDFVGLQDILHDEYLYLRETTLISKDEMVSFIKKRF